MRYVKAMLASFLPQRRRRWWLPESRLTFEHAALSAAAVQVFVFGIVFTFRYTAMLRALDPQFGSSVYGTDMVLGLLALASELFDPIGLPSLYLTLEGVVRALLILVLEEVYPSLPVVLAVALQERWRNRRTQRVEQQLAAGTPDHVEQLGEMLVITSVACKPDWGGAAVAIRGEYYQITGPHPGTRERPYAYILRPWPEGMVIRKTRQYDAPEPILATSAERDR